MSELILTSVPGIEINSNGALLRVVLVPRLTSPGKELADFGMQDWPTLIKAASFDISLATSAGIIVGSETVRVHTDVDQAVWDGFFGRIEVRPYAGQTVYAEIVAPPTTEYAEKIDEAYREIAVTNGSPAVVQKHLDGMNFEMPPAEQDTSTITPAFVPPDFHRVMALMREHPVVLRALGFIVDLTIPKALFDQCGSSGRVSVNWSTPPATFNAIKSEVTAFSRSGDRWFAAKSPLIENGVLNFQSKRLEDVKDPKTGVTTAQFVNEWSVVTFDINGAISRLADAKAASSPATNLRTDPATGQTAVMPALRTAGMSVLQRHRQAWLSQRAKRGVTRASGAPLNAEDLVLGYRIDVREGGGDWASIVRRKAQFWVNKIPIGGGELFDEGHVKPASGVLGKDEDRGNGKVKVVHSDDVLFRWDGWNMAVPRPSLDTVVRSDPHTIDAAGAARRAVAEGSMPYDFTWKFELDPLHPPVPQLRFSGAYQLRARVVDIAGGSLTTEEVAADFGATENTPYGRYEPVSPPDIPIPTGLLTVEPANAERAERTAVHQNALGPGGGLETLVVRSDPDADSTASPNVMPLENYPSNDSRMLLPPAASFSVNEQHNRLNGSDLETALHVRRALAVPRSSADASLSRNYTWLPDPAAVGVAVVAKPLTTRIAPTAVTLRKWSASWPDLGRKMLVVTPGVKGSNLEATTTATGGTDLTRITLPPAVQVTVAVSSYVSRPGLAEFAIGLNGQQSAYDAALAGQHSVLTPPRLLNVVHAVRRPLNKPIGNLQAKREPGGTSAVISDPTQPFLGLDRDSTMQVDVVATWKEWIDASDPIQTEEVVISLPLGLDDPALMPIQHEFADTKHRKVSYRITARSRFRQYFDESDDDAAFTRSEVLGPVMVPNTVRPTPPIVLSVVPAFERLERIAPPLIAADVFGMDIFRQRNGSIVRVELGGPWYTTGEGEMLGLVVGAGLLPPMTRNGSSPITAMGMANDHLLTTVYRDPIYRTGNPDQLDHTNFPDHAVVVEPESGENICVIPVPVFYSEGRRFADIKLGDLGDKTYCPFVRLSLVRYQPSSIGDFHASSIVQSEFVPILPTRWLNILFNNGRPIVQLDGLGSDSPGSYVEMIVESAPLGTPVDALSALDQASSFAWVRYQVQTRNLNVPFDELDLPNDGRAYRVRVREIEKLTARPGTVDPLAAELGLRTVFADVVSIRE